jgi:hypothetical protein
LSLMMSSSYFFTCRPCCTFWRSHPPPSPYWSSIGCAKKFSLPWQTTWDCCVFKHRVFRSHMKKWKSSDSNASRSLTRYLADAWDGAKLHHMVSQGTMLLYYTFMLLYLQPFSWWFQSCDRSIASQDPPWHYLLNHSLILLVRD